MGANLPANLSWLTIDLIKKLAICALSPHVGRVRQIYSTPPPFLSSRLKFKTALPGRRIPWAVYD